MLLFFSNNFVFDEFMRSWEMKMVNINGKNYDVGVLLGGGIVTYDKAFDRYIFRKNTDRLWQTIELYKTGIIKKMLISGGPGSLSYRNYNEADLIKKYLLRIGIDSADIIVDNKSDNTYQNAFYCAKIIKEVFPNGKYLLITSSYHMRRSNACFAKQGIVADLYPVDKYAGDVRNMNLEHIIVPNIITFSNWSLLFHEWIGYVVYLFSGYL
ncbi:MAG: hypothetical protein A2X12_01165 [Bacteroidetes bacterium GWE2_29_8]|nr:MAG: hypothetical protein A2X12_01165 [Bacteroidetes bacterium GWE2_29_8]OFY14421.1 MAG: hypothetical protein A2X02_01300 [Bacteroidetes bacterium GWF2_29_10]